MTAKPCPLFQTTGVLGKKWTLVLLEEISRHGNKGFNELFRQMKKISPKLLAERLQTLEKQGVVSRTLVENSPLRTSYHLTKKGEDLYKIVRLLKQWNTQYSSLESPCEQNICVECEQYTSY